MAAPRSLSVFLAAQDAALLHGLSLVSRFALAGHGVWGSPRGSPGACCCLAAHKGSPSPPTQLLWASFRASCCRPRPGEGRRGPRCPPCPPCPRCPRCPRGPRGARGDVVLSLRPALQQPGRAGEGGPSAPQGCWDVWGLLGWVLWGFGTPPADPSYPHRSSTTASTGTAST